MLSERLRELAGGAHLVLICQRIYCAAMEIEDASGSGRLPMGHYLPEGWGFDLVAGELVLHCPEHRDAVGD